MVTGRAGALVDRVERTCSSVVSECLDGRELVDRCCRLAEGEGIYEVMASSEKQINRSKYTLSVSSTEKNISNLFHFIKILNKWTRIKKNLHH